MEKNGFWTLLKEQSQQNPRNLREEQIQEYGKMVEGVYKWCPITDLFEAGSVPTSNTLHIFVLDINAALKILGGKYEVVRVKCYYPKGWKSKGGYIVREVGYTGPYTPKAWVRPKQYKKLSECDPE